MKFDRHIDIGSLEAEDDAFLLESFITKTDYKSLSNTQNQKCIILGRTGMGKSALIRKLEESMENVTRIKPEEMSLRFLSNSDIINYFRRLGINLDLFYKVLWKHVFIVEILKLFYGEDKVRTGNKISSLIESVDFKFNKKKKNAIEYLRKWHDTFWEDTEYRVKEIEDTLRKSLRKTLGADAKLYDEFVSAKVGAEADKVIAKSKKTDVIHKAQSVVNNIQLSEISTILNIIHTDLLPKTQKKFYIVIDDLDKHWVDKKIVYDLILALTHAIKEINNCPNLKVIISLRLNLLQLALQKANTTGFQREKFENMFLHLYWDEKELKDLLQKRLDLLFTRNYEKPVKLEDILPKSPNKGRKKDGFQYMLDRSFMRPRDIISFFNKSIRYSNSNTKISRESIHLAENDYSLERLNAIEDEWNENFPFLKPYFKVIKSKSFKFTEEEILPSEIKQFCYDLNSKPTHPKLRAQIKFGWKGRKLKLNKKHVLNTLYLIGCIGIKQTSESKVLYSFRYNNTLDAFDLNDEHVYFINPAFNKTLMIKTN